MKPDKEGSGNDVTSWSVDDVIRFVQEADPQTLGPHIELFRKHVSTEPAAAVQRRRVWNDPPPPPLQEIDGRALMLLRSDIIMKYMGLKLGPALKLCHHIERLKQSKQ